MTRPLGTFLINFEQDTDREWNLYGLSPLRQALHSNRWKQPELEQAASEFLWGKYLSNDPLKMYVAFRIWNSYLPVSYTHLAGLSGVHFIQDV